MARLQDILYKVKLHAVEGDMQVEVNSIQIDSRKVSAGDVFVAIRGVNVDGHHFINKAIELGAVAVVYDTFPDDRLDGITYIQVDNTNEALAYISHNFYGEPSSRVKLVGVTETNGSTENSQQVICIEFTDQ